MNNARHIYFLILKLHIAIDRGADPSAHGALVLN